MGENRPGGEWVIKEIYVRVCKADGVKEDVKKGKKAKRSN
jgi:hypothetical protein